jgi:uncharacterized protein (UPF0333 family)
MERKGQAAMEFLMTYGWAILAAVIAIAVLAYFGVFSPGRYVPDACTLSPPLGCDTDNSIATGSVNMLNLTVTNTGADDITIVNVTATNCNTGEGNFVINPVSIPVGGEEIVSVDCSSVEIDSGEKLRSSVTVSYTKSGVDRHLTASGSITTTVL